MRWVDHTSRAMRYIDRVGAISRGVDRANDRFDGCAVMVNRRDVGGSHSLAVKSKKVVHPNARTVIVTVRSLQVNDLSGNSVISERPNIRTIIVIVQSLQVDDLSKNSLFPERRRSCARLLRLRAVLVQPGSRGKRSASRLSMAQHIIRVIGVW